MKRRSNVTAAEAGFTLVEVIVSMVLLGLVALLILPAVATGSRAGAVNRDMTTAAQYASTELSAARAAVTRGDCNSVLSRTGGSITTWPNGYKIEDRVTGTCAVGTTVKVKVTVSLLADSARSTSATTLILVTS